MRCLTLAAACGMVACFGSGPVPSAPTAATVVFTVPADPSDCIGYYIAGVALGSGTAFIETPEYAKPSSNNNCGTSGDPNAPVPVWSVAMSGGSAQMVVSIGPDPNYGPPRIAATGSDVEWAIASNTGGSAIQIGAPMEQNVDIAQPSSVNGNSTPIAYLVDGSGSYVASWQGYAAEGPASPNYPQTGGGGGTAVNYIVNVTSSASSVLAFDTGNTPSFACDSAYDCIAMDPMNFFWFDATTMAVRVAPRAGGAGSNAGPFAGQAPAGITTGAGVSAWTLSTDFRNQPLSEEGCTVFANAKMLFASTHFQCSGAATDGTYVYFAIVQASQQSGSPRVDGIGLGRVAVATGALESIALGESDDDVVATGPRRVYYEPQTKRLWAVDPRVIATFDPDALAGHHDFQ